MKLLVVVSCILAGALAAPPLAGRFAEYVNCYNGKYRGDKVMQVTPMTDEQSELLEAMRNNAYLDLDFWNSPKPGSTIEIHVTEKNARTFCSAMEARGMTCKEMISDLQSLVDDEHRKNLAYLDDNDPSLMVVGRYARTNEIHSWMDNLARITSIMSIESIGTSTEGRDLKLAKFSTGSGRPAIFIHSGLHSREWISHATITWIMNQLASTYGRDATVTTLLNRYDWYFLPVANPDGYEYTHDYDRFWRKTRSRTSSARCSGVDANRNFDSNFAGTGASSNPCSDTYHGPRAFSEPETAAIARFVLNHGNVVFYMDTHAYSQMWLVPYGYTNRRPSDYRELDAIASLGTQAIYNTHRRSFRIGTPGQLLYIASGGAFDWAKSQAGVKYAYTLELRPASGGMMGFVVDPSEIPYSGQEIWAGLSAAVSGISV